MIRVGLEVKVLGGRGSTIQSTPEIIHRSYAHHPGQYALDDQSNDHQTCQAQNALWQHTGQQRLHLSLAYQ